MILPGSSSGILWQAANLGGRSENPTAKLFLDNTVSIRVQGSVALDLVRGNCWKRQQAGSMIDETPLPK